MERQHMSKFGTELTKNERAQSLIKQGIKDTLDEESYKDFEKALSSSVTAPAIVAALKTFGIEVSDNTIRRWKKEASSNV